MPAKKPRAGRGVRKAGRPSLMTPDRVERICDALANGATRHHAARFAGISRPTLQEWLSRGHAGEEPYVGFLDRVEQAEAKLVVQLAEEITADPAWQAKAWMLKRKDASYRDPPQQIELSNPDGSLQPIGQVLTLTPEAVRSIRDLRRLELAASPTGQPSAIRPVSE